MSIIVFCCTVNIQMSVIKVMFCSWAFVTRIKILPQVIVFFTEKKILVPSHLTRSIQAWPPKGVFNFAITSSETTLTVLKSFMKKVYCIFAYDIYTLFQLIYIVLNTLCFINLFWQSKKANRRIVVCSFVT